MPTRIRYLNNLPGTDPNNPILNPNDPAFSIQALVTVDQTVDWADPLGLNCLANPTAAACRRPYLGPVPSVAHLHGGEVPSAFDGGPLAWWTPGFAQTGSGFVTDTYTYPNQQEPGTLWFHDHALGATRTNVFSGLAAFYLLRDAAAEPANLPANAFEVELAIQDRRFDTNGQLIFPDVGINPQHPFWVPEFFGDTIVVNGATWPFMNVEARRYRFRVLNGSNGRFYDLSFGKAPVWVIGSDDNYLDAPKPVNSVFLAPGERADIIVDFSAMAGKTFVVSNVAKAPFPAGAPADPATVGQIIQFRVGPALAVGADASCNPALNPAPPGIPTQCVRPVATVKLATAGAVAPGVQVDRVRRLTLNEVLGAGGPLELVLNNTHYRAPATEQPRVGSTELWEIINTTADTHPIHTHLVQMQIVNRQAYQAAKYFAAYSAAFPGGVYLPSSGPPLRYDTGATTVVNGQTVPLVGGNPDVTPFLQQAPMLPDPWESGWKDTIKFNPGEVIRVLVRWAPTDAPATGVACPSPANPVAAASRPCRPVPGSNLFAFDPTLGITTPMSVDFSGNPGGPGYVWHCHMVDHEDNEMMRPYFVTQ